MKKKNDVSVTVGGLFVTTVILPGSDVDTAPRSSFAIAFSVYFPAVTLSHVAVFFFFHAEDGIRDRTVTGVQTCALPISSWRRWSAGWTCSTASRRPATG